MTTYKEIKGTQIEIVSSDPSNPVEGQVWYNSTDQAVKGQSVTTAGSWATVTSLNTARRTPGAGGTSTAALAAAGYSGSTYYGNTETFNGTNWTEVNDLALARSGIGMCGATNTAVLGFGGGLPGANPTANTENWNGTNWTEVNNLNTARRNLSEAGTNTAALAFGGTSPSSNVAVTETWNGTNWTEVNDLNTVRYSLAGAGTNTAGLAFGGYGTAQSAVTETWNGTNWTEVNDLNTARYGIGGTGTTNTESLAFGGQPGVGSTAALTEVWNGTNWTEEGDLNTARVDLRGAGSYTAAIAFGGEGPPVTAAAEQFTGAGASVTRTFTDS